MRKTNKQTIFRVALVVVQVLGVVLVGAQDVVFDRVIENAELSEVEFQRLKNMVRKSEAYRGNQLQDFYYNMTVIDTQDKEVKSTTVLKVSVSQNIKSGDRRSLSVVQSGVSKGNKILQNAENMWFYKPGTSNALRISPAQRFSGGASYADISSTNYTFYYDPVSVEDVTLGDITAIKINLSKVRAGVSFDKVALYVVPGSSKPIKSEFFTRSGKLVKTMYFRNFGKIASINNASELSREWVIVDNINTKNVTTIRVDDMGVEKLSAANYSPDGLLE